MDLVDRKFRILQAIIDDYILTALPVGSRTISRKYEQKLSSATIRNEMSDLEELGYLDSPHTSAGRVPSYKAYRLYVDHMMRPTPLSVEETAFIQSCFDHRFHQVEEMSTRIARALSSMTHYTAAVVARRPKDEQIVSHLQLVPLAGHNVLLVMVMQNGAVQQNVLNIDDTTLSSDDLYSISRILSQQLEGCPVSEIGRALGQIDVASQETRSVMRAMFRQRPKDDSDVAALAVGGRSNLLDYPEYSDVDKARSLLSVLETREKLVSLLSQGGEMEISVRIGPETGMEEMKDCSVVTASFRMSDGTVNTIGLIGPTRMQYGKALSVLQQVGCSLHELIDGRDGITDRKR